MRLVLTAGYRRAPAALAVAEKLRRQGTVVSKVLITSTFNVRRLRSYVTQRGWKSTLGLTRKILGSRPRNEPSVLAQTLADWDISSVSLPKWSAEHQADCHLVPSLNSPAAVDILRQSKTDGVIYCGGGILRRRFLDAVNGRVLNAHSGKLPEVRGMNACEWSVLLGVPLHTTIHFIDRGIDTGQLVETIPVKPEPGDTLDDLRDRCVVAGIEGLVRNAATAFATDPMPSPDVSSSFRQCYIMAPAIRALTEARWMSTQHEHQGS